MKPFMNPLIDDDKSGSSMDQSIKQYNQDHYSELRDLELALGKIPSYTQEAGGRSLNIPNLYNEQYLPGPTYNSGLYIGSPCKGSHCGIPIEPTYSNYASLFSRNNPNISQGVHQSFYNQERIGNNSPILNQLGGSLKNSKKYNFIYNPYNLEKINIYSIQGKRVLNKYLKYFLNKNL